MLQRCDAPQEAKAKQTGGSQSARELRCLGCKSLCPRHLSCLPVWTFPYGIVICLNQLLQQLVRSDTRVTIRLLRKCDTLDFITIVNFYIYKFFCFNIYNIHSPPPPCCIKTLITYLSFLTTSFCTMKQGFEYKGFCQLHFILLLNPDDPLVRSADIVLAHRRYSLQTGC